MSNVSRPLAQVLGVSQWAQGTHGSCDENGVPCRLLQASDEGGSQGHLRMNRLVSDKGPQAKWKTQRPSSRWLGVWKSREEWDEKDLVNGRKPERWPKLAKELAEKAQLPASLQKQAAPLAG